MRPPLVLGADMLQKIDAAQVPQALEHALGQGLFKDVSGYMAQAVVVGAKLLAAQADVKDQHQHAQSGQDAVDHGQAGFRRGPFATGHGGKGAVSVLQRQGGGGEAVQAGKALGFGSYGAGHGCNFIGQHGRGRGFVQVLVEGGQVFACGYQAGAAPFDVGEVLAQVGIRRQSGGSGGCAAQVRVAGFGCGVFTAKVFADGVALGYARFIFAFGGVVGQAVVCGYFGVVGGGELGAGFLQLAREGGDFCAFLVVQRGAGGVFVLGQHCVVGLEGDHSESHGPRQYQTQHVRPGFGKRGQQAKQGGHGLQPSGEEQHVGIAEAGRKEFDAENAIGYHAHTPVVHEAPGQRGQAHGKHDDQAGAGCRGQAQGFEGDELVAFVHVHERLLWVVQWVGVGAWVAQRSALSAQRSALSAQRVGVTGRQCGR